MIALSTPTFDLSGSVILQESPGSALSEVSRRNNRIATLNGGSVLNDAGYSASDRTFRVIWRVRNKAELASVQRLVKLYAIITVATVDGVFNAAPERVDVRDGDGQLTLLIMEELT